MRPEAVHDLIASIYEQKARANVVDDEHDDIDRDSLPDYLVDYFAQQFGTVMAGERMKKFKASLLHYVSKEETSTWRMRWFSILVAWDEHWEREMDNCYTPYRKDASDVWLDMLSQLMPIKAIEERMQDEPCRVDLPTTLHCLCDHDTTPFKDISWRHSESFKTLMKNLYSLDLHIPEVGSKINVDHCCNFIMQEWYRFKVGSPPPSTIEDDKEDEEDINNGK